MRMKSGFTSFLLFISFLQLFGQQYQITGVVRDQTGEPLIGVSVTVKGTTNGTITGLEGDYTINASYDATLIFNYIGYNELVEPVNKRFKINVTMQDMYGGHYVYEYYKNPYVREHVPPQKEPDMLSFFKKSGLNGKKGIGVLTDKTPAVSSSLIDISDIRSIKKNKTDSLYHVDYFDENDRRSGYDIVYFGSIGIDKVMKLPKLQNNYSQGLNGKWSGPDKLSVFSWGEEMNKLEFDGSEYSYDKNGRLVPVGMGNGMPAKIYKPGSFFRTGFQTVNDLSIKLPAVLKGYYEVAVKQSHREGVIRGSNSDSYSISLAMKRIQTGNYSFDVFGSYKYSEGNLLRHGANQASILGSLFSTPVSFDNTNGLNPRKAAKNAAAWSLPDGSVRSFAPGLADNPYGLIDGNRDRDKLHEAVAGFDFRNNGYRFTYGVTATIDNQKDIRTIGINAGERGFSSDYLYNRHQEYFSVKANAFISTRIDRVGLNASFNYGFNRDILNTGNKTAEVNPEINRYKGFRNKYELQYSLDYRLEKIHTDFRFSNRHYLSNTSRDHVNFFPSLGFNTSLGQIFGFYSWRSPGVSLIGSFSKYLREMPLVTGEEPAFTNLPVSRYREYIPIKELIFHSDLRPEIYTDKIIGLSFSYRNIFFNVEYFRTDIKDFITTYAFRPENTANIKNQGLKFSGGYKFNLGNCRMELDMRWYKDKPVVKKLHSSQEHIPLAGFNDIYTGLAKGKSIGVIFGTDFKRDNSGTIIIGEDGFPVKDDNIKIVGDPTPDWRTILSPKVSWQRFKLMLNFDIKKGGDMWNGTQTYLDYLGRSQKTAGMRNIKDYVFEGVTEKGTINTLPVDFNSDNTMENRWVRYGYSGVTSENIQDASWIRLSELKLEYNPRIDSQRFKQLTLGLSIYNVFLLTRYKGTDPAASLFNYSSGTGLDLFNSPGVRTFMFSVKMRISDVL